jgi:hypothetical protein
MRVPWKLFEPKKSKQQEEEAIDNYVMGNVIVCSIKILLEWSNKSLGL